MSRRDKRKLWRAIARTCRFQCGRRFDANFDPDRARACPECRPLLNAAIAAVNAPSTDTSSSTAKRAIRVQLLIKRIKKNRVEFEAALRLGADAATLRSLLGWSNRLGWRTAAA